MGLMDVLIVLAGLSLIVVGMTIPILMIRFIEGLGGLADSAGPDEVTFAPPPGQEQTPWELLALVRLLPPSPEGLVSAPIVNTLNRFLETANLTEFGQLPPNPTVYELQLAVAVLENHLEIGPLYQGVHIPSGTK